MTLYEAYQLLAARAVLLPDREAWYRHVCRWYSKTYNTPLHEVHDLPLDFVLQNYYEGVVEEMDEEQRSEYLEEVVRSDDERKQAKVEEAKAEKVDEAFFDKLSADVKAESLKGPPKERPKKRLALKKELKDEAMRKYGVAPVTEAGPPPSDVQGPGFSATFGGNLLEQMGDFDPLAPPPRKK